MSRKRLHKSTDAVISGVCGGIAEYFGIDATLVRIITVVLCIVGLGFPIIIYVVCMFVMPPDPAVAQGYVDARAECTKPPCQHVYASVAADATATDAPTQPPPPDPSTRVSAAQATAADAGNASATFTSAAAESSAAADGAATQETSSAAAKQSVGEKARSYWPTTVWFGAVLIAIGVIALLCNLVHLSLWRCWPVVIIVAGLVSLFTPGARGWSLERAGNSIVVITVGLALLAWMLQIVPFRVFVIAFKDLWPALLVVLGLAIIGGAQKSSALKLFSSLLLSATVLFGIWFYAGLDWANLGSSLLLIEGDGLGELIADLARHGD